MSEIRVRKFETKYRLPGSLRAECRRLDQLGAPVVEAAFAQAIDRLNLPEENEVCIRDISARVSLRLNSTDKSLIAQWSTALADEIFAAVQNASTRRAVVYHSRRQALVDLGVSVSRGDLRRCWAWRQLGLWRSRGVATAAQGVEELVHSLCDEPVLLVPTLRALASSGCLPQIASRLTEDHWKALAAVALSEGESTHLLNQPAPAPTPRAMREAWRVINSSPFLRSIASLPWMAQANLSVRRSIAALAVLDVDPVLLRSKSASALIDVIASVTTLSEQTRTASRTTLSANEIAATSISASPTLESTEHTVLSANEAATPTSAPATDKLTDRSPQSEELNAVAETIDAHENRELPRARRSQANVVAETLEVAPPLDLRERAFTRWGGLLFLFSVFEELSLPEALLEHPVLGERRFTWVLHQLALTMAPIPTDDPAALAFAGLPPQARPPSATEAPPTAIEIEALNDLAITIIERLSSLLDFSNETPAAVLEFVCCRRAEIAADPGWIEARFSLDEVSTEIRRAGLDLDPGHVSWLGIVVRFAYE